MFLTKLLDIVTLSFLLPKKRRKVISSIVIVGVILVVIATFITSYKVPELNSELIETELKISDHQNLIIHLELAQYMSSVPLHLTNLLELFPTAPNWIKDDFEYEFRKAEIGYLEMLYPPTRPGDELHQRWKSLSLSELESERERGVSTYAQSIQNDLNKRKELLHEKEGLTFWTVITQLFGIFMTSFGMTLKTLYK